MDFLTQDTISVVLERAGAFITVYGLKVLGAIIVLFFGLFVIKRINALLRNIFDRVELDQALESFLQSLLSVALRAVLVIIVISMLGVETTSLVALLGAAGLAVGLALQGSLANFAGGALILFFKPFTVGDRIETPNHTGTVEDIQILYTILRNRNNEKIVIPNGELSNNSLKNQFANEYTGLEIDFGIGYGDDIDKAKMILKKLITADERILKSPEPVIVVHSLGESSVNIRTRSFVKDSADYWAVGFDLTENVKKEFDKEEISIPFPQRDVHLYKH